MRRWKTISGVKMKNMKWWDWVVWNQRVERKIIEDFMPSKSFIFLCMYKMVVEITKETWEKCGIKTVKHYNEKDNITELWQKVSDIETQIKHSNIYDGALKRIKKYYKKKKKNITEWEKQKYKAYFKGKTGIFIIEKLRRDIIERDM